ncbi:MAG: N(4)-(beta-N-acetylglucosaminyl)-L-asparaginase [Chloroflexota bacterium]
MIVVASSNGSVGIQAAVDVLKNGGSAIDAVEAGIRPVEANPEDKSVGYNGYPNLLGEPELDASIMNGRTLETGAVAALSNYTYPISVARRVMETLPHVLLVGDGANRFTTEMGFEQEGSMVSDEMEAIWETRLKKEMSNEVFDSLPDRNDLHEWVRLTTDPRRTYGTTNLIAMDKNGNICSGVSTSGWAWKFPGRVGDSPIIGAGNYADNRYGAATCTGMGEMAIRASTAHSIVFYMKMGYDLQKACREAMLDLNDLGGKYLSVMNFVAIDKDGNHAGYSTQEGRTYIYQTPDMAHFEEVSRTIVDVNQTWKLD